MWTTFRYVLLLVALLASPHVQAQSNAGTGTSDVLITMPIEIDGSLKNLQLMRGESYMDAATSFARTNGLMSDDNDNAKVQQVIDQLSELLKDKMEEIEAQGKPPSSVQLTIPLMIENYSADLKKYEGESVEAAVERFLYASGLSMDTMREAYPQLISRVNEKLAQLQPPQKELFALTFTIHGREATVRHFENGDPMLEAISTLQSIDLNDSSLIDHIAPQIANEITRRINEVKPSQPTSDVDTQHQHQQQSQPPETQARREIFSIPITINDRAAILVHYEGSTATETAVQFLRNNGVTDTDTINVYAPQLVDIVDTRMAEILMQEAEQSAASHQEQLQQPVDRKLLLTLPISFGDNQSANFEYFEGDNIERTVELFLVSVGITENDASFNTNVAQLSQLVRDRLPVMQSQDQAVKESGQHPPVESNQELSSNRPAPLFTLPITLSGREYDLEYFEGQEPGYVANTFCVEKHEIIRNELGVDFNGQQLLECKNLLVKTINNVLAAHHKAGEPKPEQVERSEPKEETANPRGPLLFTLDIDMGDDTTLQLPVHRHDNPSKLATEFCAKHNLDSVNIPALTEGIELQLAGI